MQDDRLALAGPLSVAISALSIGGAILAAPTFSFTGDALSDLGVRAGSAPIFNGGLILAGVVGFGFAVWLFLSATDVLQQVGAGLAGVALLGLAGVGVFPLDRALHAPAALTFYLGFTYALFVHGSGSVRIGETGWGLATVWTGIAHLSAWFLWFAVAGYFGIGGITIPETIGAAFIAGWTVWTALRGS